MVWVAVVGRCVDRFTFKTFRLVLHLADNDLRSSNYAICFSAEPGGGKCGFRKNGTAWNIQANSQGIMRHSGQYSENNGMKSVMTKVQDEPKG
jgi:hypothetical protein